MILDVRRVVGQHMPPERYLSTWAQSAGGRGLMFPQRARYLASAVKPVPAIRKHSRKGSSRRSRRARLDEGRFPLLH